MRYARTRFWIIALITGAIWIAAMLLGGTGSPEDLALHRSLYAADDAVLARNAALLTRFGGWAILVPAAIVAAATARGEVGRPRTSLDPEAAAAERYVECIPGL